MSMKNIIRIEPDWNVKNVRPEDIEDIVFIRIEPDWNVKFNFQAAESCITHQNRTRLECKGSIDDFVSSLHDNQNRTRLECKEVSVLHL